MSSSSSCYDDTPSELSDNGLSAKIEEKSCDEDKTVVITQSKVVARRFEFWHEKFLNYKEILNYLRKLRKFHADRCTIQYLGYSKEHRPICLIKISSSNTKRPLISVFIEAGSNGREKMAVSSALYLIDYLVKNDNKLVVEFLIIPCLNPDAYDKFVKGKKLAKKDQLDVDLTKCFPVKDSDSPGFTSYKKFKTSSDTPTNCSLLTEAVEKHRMNVKLFISLQASESTIKYPMDYYVKDVYDFAVACRRSMEWDSLDIGPLISGLNQDKGTAVEHLIQKYHQTLKFAYILNVHSRSFLPDEEFILAKGEQMLTGILTLTKRVVRYYYRQKDRYELKTDVKLLDSNE